MPHTGTTHAARVAGKNGFSIISDEKFRDLYAALLKCSLLDERLRAFASYESWNGDRASAAGIVSCLRAGDTIIPTPRAILASYLHHGRLELRVDESAVGAASHLTAATGEGLRHKLNKSGGVVVVFTGLADPELLHAVFSAAAQQSLPILYTLEGGTPAAEVCAKIPVMRVDAADAVAFYRVAHESVLRAREGSGPTIVECAPWPGDRDTDPLTKLENYLSTKRLFRHDWKRRLETKFADATAEAAADCLSGNPPKHRA